MLRVCVRLERVSRYRGAQEHLRMPGGQLLDLGVLKDTWGHQVEGRWILVGSRTPGSARLSIIKFRGCFTALV